MEADKDYRFEFDKLTRILRVNGVRFEDLEPLERNNVLGILFRGGQERAQLEGERGMFAEQCEALEAAKEKLEWHRAILGFIVLLIVAVEAFNWFLF